MILEQPTWKIKDSSKLSDWLDCPRMYFFRHMLGWRVDRPNHDAYFGESWHKAREYQLLHGYHELEGAYSAFIEHYRKEFPQDTDVLYTPKDPTAAMLALQQIAQQYPHDLDDNKVLYTEISGTVPVDQKGRVLHYRMDSVIERADGKIFSWDHKSAKRFSRQWAENFFLSIQTGTYTHCMYCMYPIDQVIGIEYCGTAFEYMKRTQEYRISFQRVPAWKTPDQMNVWLWLVNVLLDDIERETNNLMNYCTEDDTVLMAFPLNPNSCSKYWGCAYHGYCMSWSNPLRYCYESPLGFKQEFWNPSLMETTNKINLEWR